MAINANAQGPRGLPITTPAENNASLIALGKSLFFDKRLSANGAISCASCHVPEKAFTDGLPVAKGIHGQRGTRNTPSLWNAAFSTSQFWDGRRSSLEQQATDPLLNPREHGLRSTQELLTVIRRDPHYPSFFKASFDVSDDAISSAHVATALASFERTLLSGNSPVDRFFYGREKTALTASAQRGLELFRGRAQCEKCHAMGEKSALFTDNQFHSLGVGFQRIEANLAASSTRAANASPAELDRLILEDRDTAELGHFVVTKQPSDIARFKTPSLRNVGLTAPYMHDGSVATLSEAVEREIYYRSLEINKPLIFTAQEKADLVAFLNALSSPNALAFVSAASRKQ